MIPSSSSSSSSPSDGGLPPMKNHFLTLYDGFVRDTPLICRTITLSYLGFWVISFFINPNHAIANIPYFTIYKYEFYRLIISPCICGNIFSMIFSYLCIQEHLKRIEYSIGSSHFVWLVLVIDIITNITHVILSFVAAVITKDTSWLHVLCGGTWILLLPLIAIDCLNSPSESTRRFFMWSIPSKKYPILLAFIFSLFEGSNAYLVAVSIGYIYGYGYFDWISTRTTKQLINNEAIFGNFVDRQGWIPKDDAIGSDAWNDLSNNGGEGSTSGLGLFSQTATSGSSSMGPESTGTGENTTANSAGESFPSGGGRQLGGPIRRAAGNADKTREARLKALEGRERINNNNNNNNRNDGPDNV